MLISHKMTIVEIKLPVAGFREVVLRPQVTPPQPLNQWTTDVLFEFEPITTFKVQEDYANNLSIGQEVLFALEWVDAIGAAPPWIIGSAIEDNIDKQLWYA